MLGKYHIILCNLNHPEEGEVSSLLCPTRHALSINNLRLLSSGYSLKFPASSVTVSGLRLSIAHYLLHLHLLLWVDSSSRIFGILSRSAEG